MSDIEVKALAEMIKAPVDKLLKQLQSAGINVSNPEDKITDAQKLTLLERMRGGDVAKPAGGSKITLNSGRSKLSLGGGRKGSGVEVRRKKTISRPGSEEVVAQEVDEHAEAEARRLEEERSVREALIQKAEEERRQLATQSLQTPEEMAAAAVAAEEAASAEPERVDTSPNTTATAPSENEAVDNAVAQDASDTPAAVDDQASKERPAATEEVPAPVDTVPASKPKSSSKPAGKPSADSAKTKTTAPTGGAAPAAPAARPDPVAEGLKRREAVANAARAEAAAALKRRPSRVKPKPAPAAAAPAKPAHNPMPAPAPKTDADKGDRKKGKTRRNDGGGVRRQVKGKRRLTRKEQQVRVNREVKHGFEKPIAPVVREIEVPSTIVVSDLAQKLAISSTDIIKELMKMGMMMTINQSLDQETAILVTEELGHVGKPMQEMDDDAMVAAMLGEQSGSETVARPPVVTIMGHVDHGKTSLLDYIRSSRVASGEAGGITQHIGAYHVDTDHGTVTFLDTPGHSAFTKMRARGAEVTDIVILIVAADDGVMPQTKEAIQHAKAAEVPIVVVINKMDKEDADPDRVLNELSQHEVLTEDWGGDVPVVRVSAKTGAGIDDLLETLLLVAEVQELQAPVDVPAKGSVIEASIERGRGAVATILVREGVLRKGDLVLCGMEYGRVRALFDERGRPVKEAGPSIPVSVLGLSSAPSAGDEALAVSDERKAREIADLRKERQRDSRFAEQQSAKLNDLFDQMKTADRAAVNLLVKTDVQGSLEALRAELIGLSTEEVEVRIISSGVGGMNESDLDLAVAANAIVVAFNVRADAGARRVAQESDVEIRYYSVIYDVINDVKDAMSGLLSPETREVFTGLAEVKDVFKASNFGQVAGCLVTEGTVKRGNPIRVLRDDVVIFEGELESLRRHRDDVKEVNTGTECGIAVKDYNDVQAGDKIEVFERIEVARTI